ncbi:unnamed protein product [Ixodes pacificus]
MPRRSILSNPQVASMLTWAEINDLLEYKMRCSRESELLRYRSRHGLLDIGNVEATLFKQQFRFEKLDFDELSSALLIPQTITTAQGVRITGKEALCSTLRRLAYPNRWCDLEQIFGRHSSVMSSAVSKLISHAITTFGHLIDDCNMHKWLSPATLGRFGTAVHDKGGALPNCWAFIDGTARPMCRPKRHQNCTFRVIRELIW